MDCEKCGAEIASGADTCPECGEPVAAAAEEPTVDESADEAPADESADEAPADLEPPVAVTPSSGGKRPVLVAALVVLIVGLIAGGAWLVTSRVAANTSPEAAAKAMLEAYAVYNAAGILEVSTHASMTASDTAAFETQAAEAKKAAKDLPSIKNIIVGKSSVNATDRVSVDVTADWLDPATGKYATRTESLVLVKQGGKWLVELF